MSPSQSRIQVADAACAIAFLIYAASALITPISLITLTRELDFGLLRGGLLESMRTLLIVLSLLACGWLAAHWGKMRALGFGHLALGLGLLLYAISPVYAILLAALGVVGVGSGIIEGLVNPLIQDVHPNDSGRYLNMINGFWSVGVLVTVLLAGDLLTRGASWRWISVTLAALSLAVGVGFLILGRHAPPDGGRPIEVLSRKLAVLKHPRFRWFWMAMFLAAGVEGAFTFWSAAYIQLRFAAEPRVGGIGTAFFAAGMIVGRFGSGWLVGQRRLRRLILASASAGFCISLLVPLTSSPVHFSGLVFAAGLSVACFWPSIQSYAADRIEADSTSLFVLLSCGGIPGIAVMVWLMGWIGEREGLERSFLLIPAGFLLLMVVMLFERQLVCANDK